MAYYYVEDNNWTTKLQDAIKGVNFDGSYNYSLSGFADDSPNDPAPGCQKKFVATYACGKESPKTVMVENAGFDGGKTAVFNCSSTYRTCEQLALILGNDGSLTIRSRIPDLSGNVLWTNKNDTMLRGLADKALVDDQPRGRLIHSDKNYLTADEFLGLGEYIISTNKKFRLVLEVTGAMTEFKVVYIESGCNNTGSSMVLDGSASKLYNINSLRTDIGKIGYVDDYGMLHNYPNSLTDYSADFEMIGNYGLSGTDLYAPIVNNVNECKTKCSDYNSAEAAAAADTAASNAATAKTAAAAAVNTARTAAATAAATAVTAANAAANAATAATTARDTAAAAATALSNARTTAEAAITASNNATSAAAADPTNINKRNAATTAAAAAATAQAAASSASNNAAATVTASNNAANNAETKATAASAASTAAATANNALTIAENRAATANDAATAAIAAAADANSRKSSASKKCVGFVYEKIGNVCHMKDDTIYSSGNRFINNNYEYYMRNKSINAGKIDSSCPLTIMRGTNEDWGVYADDPKKFSTTNMTGTTKCGLGKFTETETAAVKSANDSLNNTFVGSFLSLKDALMDKYTTIKSRLMNNEGDIDGKLNELQNTRRDLGDWTGEQLKLLEAMNEDRDLNRISQNYKHILWSILAIIIIIAAIRITRSGAKLDD